MLEIKNLSEKDLKETEAILKKFVPYAQKQLGYDQPVKLMFISDPDNATNPLGKTAHYQPGTKVVTIYVDERHPKDIMRSVSHELVHHAQNCRGEFDKTPAMGDGYAQADEHLREMEREAYEKGNLIFRDFEDGLKTNNKEMTIYINDSSGEAPANLYEEKKMKKNKFGLKSPHAKWQAFLLSERTDKKKAAWMQAFQNAAGNPQPPPRDFWDTATYLYSKGDDPVEAGKQYAANNLNEAGDRNVDIIGSLVNQHGFMNVREPLEQMGFTVDFVTEPLPMYNLTKDGVKYAALNKKYVDDPDLVVGDTAIGTMNESDSPKKDMGATGKDSHWMPEAHGAEHEETGGWGQVHGNAADEAPSRQQALEAMVDLDKTVKNYLASSDEQAQKDGKDLNQIRNMFAKEFNGGATPGKFSQELKNAVSYLDTIIRDEIPQDLYYSLFPDMLEEGLTVDGKQLNVGDMVQVTGGGLTGATGEIIEFAEGKAVVRLETDADKPVFGKADDEVIVRGEQLALMGDMNEMYGEDEDYFMELEKEFPFLSKAVKAGEVPEEVAAEIAKEYGDKDEMPSGEELKESLRRVVKRVLFEELKGGQKELDADGDGDIGADDLANLRNKKKPKNEVYSKRAVLEAVIRKTIIGEEIDTSQFPNPLPKDQSGETFLSKGMRDGDKGDDVVPAGGKSIAAQDAKPSQSAIYLGKALGMAVGGVKGGNINALISADNYILDGHHRWAATMFADPSAAISGTGIGMSMTELIPVLRAAGDAYGNARRGEPAGGDVNIFKASLDDAKNAIQKMDGGTKFTKPGAAGKWLESIGGEEELAKRLEAIKAKGGEAASAPPRSEMPVIDADKGEDKNIATRLNKGAIDVKPPYADPGSDEKNKEPRPMNESRKNRIHNERYDLLMEQMLGIKPITPLSDRNNWLLEEEGKDEEDDSNNPMGYCDERSFMSAQEAEKEALGDEEENYSKSEIDALHKHPKDLKNN